jgi:hypothetical protein
MSRAPQERVMRQLRRLQELCALRRPLTDGEREEVVRLDLADRKRASVRKWRRDPSNRQRTIETSRRWNVENRHL